MLHWINEAGGVWAAVLFDLMILMPTLFDLPLVERPLRSAPLQQVVRRLRAATVVELACCACAREGPPFIAPLTEAMRSELLQLHPVTFTLPLIVSLRSVS